MGPARPPPPALLIVALAAVGVATAIVLVATQTGSDTGLLDLRIYLGASRSAATGQSIYDYQSPVYGLGSTYPPVWSLLVRPFSSASIHAVEFGWTLANLAMWAAALFLLARGHDRRLPSRVTTAMVMMVWLVTIPSAPVWNTLNQGQVNILLWLLLIADLVRVAAGRRTGGVLTGVAAAIKLTPGLFVFFYLAASRYRAALQAAVCAVGITAVVWLLAPSDSSTYWRQLLFDTSRVGDVGDTQNNGLSGVASRVGGGDVLVVKVGVAALSLALVVWAGWKFRLALDAGALIAAATIAGAATALVSPIAWTHHLVFLCFPLLLVCGQRSRWAWLVGAVATLLLVDPIGFGRNGATSTLRTALLVAVVALAGPLMRLEREWRATGARSMTEVA